MWTKRLLLLAGLLGLAACASGPTDTCSDRADDGSVTCQSTASQ
jgi:ABC-type glycerol-3-phosphate transport system substrate-binding protein